MTSEALPSTGASDDLYQDGDQELIVRLEKVIVASAGGSLRFKKELPALLRKAVDEVIDAARTGRFTIDQTEKTEKTYLGTKVEILLRNWLRLPKGKLLDLSIDGIETDIKNTLGNSWMIPSEAIGHPCILVKLDESNALFSVGIILIRHECLSISKNKDGKKSISKIGREKIYWLLHNEPYPANFWQGLGAATIDKITKHRGGTKRIDALFRLVQNRPISRTQVLAVAQQKDAMKRLRKNGGARDSLARDGIALLSGNFDKELIAKLNLPPCKADEFISFMPTNDSEKNLLKSAGHIS